MKSVIRDNVWETNSSSVHTVSIRGNEWENHYQYLAGEDGNIHVKLGEYGWSGEPCDDFRSKLAYALSMLLHSEYPGFSYYDEDFVVDQGILEELNGYHILLEAIKNNFNIDGIVIDKISGAFYPYGYIDHQSCDYLSLQDFFDDWNVDAERFLFDDNVVVHIDNDNH